MFLVPSLSAYLYCKHNYGPWAFDPNCRLLKTSSFRGIMVHDVSATQTANIIYMYRYRCVCFIYPGPSQNESDMQDKNNYIYASMYM